MADLKIIKTEYKIVFMSMYEEVDVFDDNIDVKIVLPSNLVYSATLFTISNVKKLLEMGSAQYFWAEDMIIVGDLTLMSINKVIKDIIDEDLIDSCMCMIGTTEKIFRGANGFEDIKHHGSPTNSFINR
ncbi:hypothetical protein [Pedobacter gandavensis]|uniref:hypothetical protein n=1 Tax=Pedobacter gandavensis TaxID=2679963 RepID=UPI00292E5EBF|nr:hypothetical protein [Pedobacter gandavensis]